MQFLEPALERYAEDHSAPEPEHLRALAEETRAHVALPQMLSGHLQGRFLSLLSHLVSPRVVVDIGTFTGYSALCLAEGLASDGQVHTIDVNSTLAPMVRRHIDAAGFQKRITPHIGTAMKVIPELPTPFDLVFIDADKENYPHYLELVVERARPGSLIIADNVLWSGKVLAPPADQDEETRGLVAYARAVRDHPRLSPVLVPLRDGLLVARVN
ncbi:MAG: O-methyltransferase [Flavobacteriales bacterium]|nr:O-methyltransferase [Flavobacteriales bacterium]